MKWHFSYDFFVRAKCIVDDPYKEIKLCLLFACVDRTFTQFKFLLVPVIWKSKLHTVTQSCFMASIYWGFRVSFCMMLSAKKLYVYANWIWVRVNKIILRQHKSNVTHEVPNKFLSEINFSHIPRINLGNKLIYGVLTKRYIIRILNVF